MISEICRLPVLTGLHQELIQLDQPLESLAAAFSDDEGTVLLLSGSAQDCARYQMLAVKPWLKIKTRDEGTSLDYGQQTIQLKQDPFEILNALLARFQLQSGQTAGLPVAAGLFGYFSYDLKDRIETLPVTCMDTGLPDVCLYAPSVLVVQDMQTGENRLCIPCFQDPETAGLPGVDEIREEFMQQLASGKENAPFSLDQKGFQSCFTRKEYIEAVRKIIAYLKAGDIYQANLSQRFEAGFSGDAYALFQDLFKRNPAAFFAYIQAGDHVVVSTSPERFIQVDGRKVETRPIKGTLARGKNRQADEANRSQLLNSLKDDAELTMIVDLMRNDLSRVTRYDSVEVIEHKRIEPYENVFHLVSVVQGELSNGKTPVDVIRATFPGGSITGCPKIRSMEIIDELEPVKRHVYTGSIGYLSFHGTMDLSIAIRTATVYDDRIWFSVGGGIVFDSDPEKEYQETLDKGKTLMDALSGENRQTSCSVRRAWVNGKFVDQDAAVVSATGMGFQYGAGVFETLKVEKGNIFRLAAHVERMNRAWRNLFGSPPVMISWESVIQGLIRENRFEDETLAVKLILSQDGPPGKEKRFLAAFARPYTHRLEMLGKKGLDLVSYPLPRQTPLADFKTLNYLYYLNASRYAASNHGDEALILNPDGTVSETNTANIISVQDNTVWVPESGHVLGGVYLNSVLTILSDKGYDVCNKKIQRDQFYTYPNMIVTNALMGAVPVLTLDGREIRHSREICAMINEALFAASINDN